MTPPATLAAGTATWRRMAAAVFRHELRALAHAPMTPVLLAGFLLALMAGVFTVGEFYASDRTAADLLWTFLPWAAVVFVPALAMRAYVDDQGDRSLELVRALPLDDSAVVAGKWAAGVVLLATMLAGTAPFVATLAYIGDPDWGALAVGMAGALMLLAALLALAHAAAAWTRDQTGGYVAGVTVLLAVLLAATEGVMACFEIVDSRIRDWKIRIQDTVADNASSARVVLGGCRTSLDGLDLIGRTLTTAARSCDRPAAAPVCG